MKIVIVQKNQRIDFLIKFTFFFQIYMFGNSTHDQKLY